MKVRATTGTEPGRVVGYYDHKRRREGEVFDIDEKLFSKRWMAKVDGDGVEETLSDGDTPKRRGRPALTREVI